MKWNTGIFGICLMALSLLAGEYSACFAQSLHAASVEYDGRRELTLKDGTQVILLPSLDSTAARPKYYYLPTNLHLSRSPDGTPQFLFLKFVTEKREEQGGVSGALLHFLMEFGLSADQKTEALALLRKGGSRSRPVWNSPVLQSRTSTPSGMQSAEILGAAPIEASSDAGAASFQIISGTLTDKTLTNSLITSGKAPVMPGEKIAAAARLSSNGAQLLAATFEKTSSITDVSISTDTVCYAMLPAVEGRIIFQASKISQNFETLKAEYSHYHKEVKKGPFGIFGTNVTDSKTYSENQEQWQFLQEKGLVKMEWSSRVEGELATKLFDAFTQIFMATFTEKAPASQQPPQDEKDGLKAPPPGSFNRYERRVFKRSEEMTDRTWMIKARLPIAIPVRMTANLRDWYDNVRDNPKCVASINLNDPFFSHRDIKFIMDLDAKEIFDDTVNYVTVNVRKKRTSGRDFEDHVTIDSKYLKDNGVAASMTYARGEDKNPDLYQYQAQWSLKGGNIYPSNPEWLSGSWEGVTLTPPVRPLNIEVEGDAEDMKAKDVVRVTAQVHYYKFGKETETNIQVAPAKTSAAQKIFLDRDQRNYSYRLIYHHKTAGRLVGPWVPNVSDDYIYANMPADLLELNDYKERAKGLADGVMEKILGKVAGALNP